MEKRWLIAVALTLVVAVGSGVSFVWSGAKPPSIGRAAAASADEAMSVAARVPEARAIHVDPATAFPTPTAPPVDAISISTASADAAPGLQSERQIMAQLHGLAQTNPEASLQLAREGNARFPDSPDAPERGWIVVKALTNMRRFDEARDEAKIMVARYRGTSWATDVERHVLVHPP
ncbi:MAG: hypothetical protein ABTD50_14265 [Polyangiaceae bacterium]|jgi:hypothetical protein